MRHLDSRQPSYVTTLIAMRSNESLSSEALDTLFESAHTTRAFEPGPAPVSQVRAAYEDLRWAPTAFNSQPLRLDLVESESSREELAQHMLGANPTTVINAPLALVASADLDLHNSMAELGAPDSLLQRLAQDREWRVHTSKTSAHIQLGYLILALRAHGLDVGVMTGARFPDIDRMLHTNQAWESIAVLVVGHATAEGAHSPRKARHDFDRIARIH